MASLLCRDPSRSVVDSGVFMPKRATASARLLDPEPFHLYHHSLNTMEITELRQAELLRRLLHTQQELAALTEELCSRLHSFGNQKKPFRDYPPGRMSRATLFNVIVSEYKTFTEHRSQYDVKPFRQHCLPLLEKHFCAQDLEIDSDCVPKWYRRFNYAHKQIASSNNYVHVGNGIYSSLDQPLFG